MKLGIKDERVLRAFAEHKALEGHKLSTDGRSLDGHWMGGRNLAVWRRGKRGMQIHLPDTGGRVGQSIQRALKRHAAPVDFEGYKTFGERASRDLRSPGNPRGLGVGDAVQLRYEPGTSGLIQRFEPNVYGEARGWAWVATSNGKLHRLPTHALRLRRSSATLRDSRPRKRKS